LSGVLKNPIAFLSFIRIFIKTNMCCRFMSEFQKNMLIGIWSGSIASFIVLFAQSLLQAYNQPLNMCYAFSIILGINLLIVLGVAWLNSRGKKSNSRK
jgi:hypothetical protein